jgi:hypothetical protein
MIALASVIASPLFWPVRGAPGVRPLLFLAKEEHPSAVASTAATYRGRLHRQEPTFQAQSCRQLGLQLNSDNCIVSVYCSVDFVNRQFVTYMAA